ncbi:hypothetical protein [Psychrobacillus sp. FSL H8-0487]|uniref:hypothetical protein n=1 Tax=Psychrobacillus sp. FSL H8-0487 TaxID=2921391 RepID=UPI0030F8EB6C
MTNKKELCGLKEFATIVGWKPAKLSTKFSRQLKGMKVKNPLPQPIAILAATPVWTKQQVEEYKRSLDSTESGY